jgi:hypothetical protein
MLSKNVEKVDGEFYGTFEGTDESGYTDTYYQFKSYDNEVWWVLTANEIGCIPKSNTKYMLVYNDNGTTKEDKVCDCLEEYDCECYVYDDVFIKVIEKRK